VRSFAAPAAAAPSVRAAPAVASAPAPLAEDGEDDALIVVRLEQAAAVRAGPRFADREVASLQAGALCCGIRSRQSDGHVEWLELRTGAFFLPLVNGTARVAVLRRRRFFRVWGAPAMLRSPAFPGPEGEGGGGGAPLPEGMAVEVCATVRHGDCTLGALAGTHEWLVVEVTEKGESVND
jgi:hypothetical protein